MNSNSKHKWMICGYMWSIHICLNDMFDIPSTQLTSLLGCWPAILCVKASKMWVIWVLGAYCVYWASSRRFCNPNAHCLQNCEVVSWWSSTDPWYLNGVRFVIHFGSSMLTRFIAITHASDHSLRLPTMPYYASMTIIKSTTLYIY